MESHENNELVVMAPGAMRGWLQSYSSVVHQLRYKFVNIDSCGTDVESLRDSGVKSVVSVPVDHCKSAYGLVSQLESQPAGQLESQREFLALVLYCAYSLAIKLEPPQKEMKSVVKLGTAVRTSSECG